MAICYLSVWFRGSVWWPKWMIIRLRRLPSMSGTAHKAGLLMHLIYLASAMKLLWEVTTSQAKKLFPSFLSSWLGISPQIASPTATTKRPRAAALKLKINKNKVECAWLRTCVRVPLRRLTSWASVWFQKRIYSTCAQMVGMCLLNPLLQHFTGEGCLTWFEAHKYSSLACMRAQLMKSGQSR